MDVENKVDENEKQGCEWMTTIKWMKKKKQGCEWMTKIRWIKRNTGMWVDVESMDGSLRVEVISFTEI